MALHWDLTEITDHENRCFYHDENGAEGPGDYMEPVTNALIWSTMGIGMGEITEENYEEFYRRLVAMALASGSTMLLTGKGKNRPITLSEVKAHIGLKCNVSYENPLAFQMKLGRRVTERAGYKLKDALDEAQADAAEQVVEDASEGE
jgi:hypothetical protein